MPDEIIELQFKGTGVESLEERVNRLAAAIGKLPATYTLKVNAVGSYSGPGGASSGAPMTAAMSQSFAQSGSPTAAPIPASASPASYRVQATAVAKAASAATGGLQGLASVIGSIHPVAALAVAGLTAVVAGVASLQNRNLSSIQSDFMWGKNSGASVRGVSESLGTDPVQGPQAVQSAIDSDPVVRNAAVQAGINPNGDYYGGDTDYAKKYKRMLDFLSDKKQNPDQSYAAYVANRAGIGEQVAQLHAMDEPDRQKALNGRVDISDADQSKAADRQAEWNRVEAKLKAAGGKAAEWVADHLVTLLSDGRIVGVDGLDRALDGKSPHKDAKGSGPASAADKMESAADKMGRAAETFSHAAEGIGGGGQRSRHAFPPGWGYVNYDTEARTKAVTLGID